MTATTMTPQRRVWHWVGGITSILVVVVVFLVPFTFIVLTASKTKPQAAELRFSWPTSWQFFKNLSTVITDRNYLLVRAFGNSIILTVFAVAVMTVLGAMVAYVVQRRASPWNKMVNFLVLAGLMIPPAVVPTIWMLQKLNLFKTLPGLILVHVAFGLPFCILLFSAFLTTVPRDLDEAAIIDGAGPVKLFFRVILPLLKPVVVTVAIVQCVNVFNDFTYALYFLPGDANATVQLTLFNYQSQNVSSWNLLFMDVLIITIPPLLAYIVFNRQIVAGLTSGAVKG